jgi:hypothetical protein
MEIKRNQNDLSDKKGDIFLKLAIKRQVPDPKRNIKKIRIRTCLDVNN